ncbi:MAG: histone deacetylase [Myxococcota bacterium]
MIPSVFSPNYVVNTPARNMVKLGRVHELAQREGLMRSALPRPLDRAVLSSLHDEFYVRDFLNGRRPLSTSNNLPWSEELVSAVLLMNGGMLSAYELACEYGVAVNVANGFHHAMPDRGEAYCTFNGLALLAHCNPSTRVFVLDIDQHGGNGTETFCAQLENLTAFSIHGSRFGCTGGLRSHLRLVREARTQPELFLRALDEALELAAEHDVLVYQAGVDCHYADPHGSMGLDDALLMQRDETVAAWARKHGKPLVVCLAGGYQSMDIVCELHLRTLRSLDACYALRSVPRQPSRAI